MNLMLAPKVEYLRWIRRNIAKPKYNLALSSVKALRQNETTEGFLDLDFSRFNYDDAQLQGPAPLREGIAERYGAKPSEVYCLTGTSLGNFVACSVLLGPGDEGIVETPGYGPLQRMPEFFGAKPVFLKRRFEEGFRVDVERLKGLVTPRTKLILLTNLHNPSGVGIPRETMREIAGVAADAGAWLISDEVYLDFVRDRFPSAWGLGGNIIVTSSFTKFGGMGGIRMGWTIAPEDMLERMSTHMDYMEVVSSRASQLMGEAAMARVDRIEARTRAIVEKGRAVVDEWIEGERRAEWVPPDGGIISFPRLIGNSGKPIESLPFVEHLLRTQDTLAGPGALFGMDGHLRIGFGQDPDRIAEGLKRVSLALDSWEG